jgi:E3 ubiquitin-protein ligase TRIP12
VFDINSLKCFKAEELEDLVCGGKEEKWSVGMLAEHLTPTQGYDKNSPVYLYLLEYLAQIPVPMQRLFLQYVTGSPRLPYGGFVQLSPKLTIAKRITPEGKDPNKFLPSVMTCQNFLKVPEYTSYAVLQAKFDYALKEGQNSFTLS